MDQTIAASPSLNDKVAVAATTARLLIGQLLDILPELQELGDDLSSYASWRLRDGVDSLWDIFGVMRVLDEGAKQRELA